MADDLYTVAGEMHQQLSDITTAREYALRYRAEADKFARLADEAEAEVETMKKGLASSAIKLRDAIDGA